MNLPDVSIIITTRNEEKMIDACLRSLQAQTCPGEKIEVIVVDNGSADGTKKIAAGFGARVFDHGPERSAQRNLGIERSRGRYVLYLDADMALSRDVVAECVRTCDEEGLVGLYVPERIAGEGFWSKVRDFERGFYDATCIDAVRFVRRETAIGIGGFDETLTGPEDWDFDRRVRATGRVGIVTARIFHNEGRLRPGPYLRKKMYYARGFPAYREKWGRNDETVKKQLGAPYRLFGVFVEDGKWRRLLSHPLLTAGMLLLRLAVGCAYTVSRLPGRA